MASRRSNAPSDPPALHSASMASEFATLDRIRDLEEQWRLECEKLTLWQRPLQTLYVFSCAAAFFVYQCIVYILNHPIFIKLVLPLAVLWTVLHFRPGSYSPAVEAVEFSVEYVAWWVGLGILSSIGLGSGLQTGVLFMFPHIIKVCLTAEACKSVAFEHFTAIWFRSTATQFQCPASDIAAAAYPATYFAVWRLVIVPSFLQSAGTAIGEIPPYWITRASRLAELQAGERQGKMPDELETASQYEIVNRVKTWLVGYLKTHGFLGVFLMAAWPNFAFDLCGICCGHFLMPFWTFFGATLLGKAFVRNTYQTLFMVAIFNEKYLEKFIVFLQNLIPDSLNLDDQVRKLLEDVKASSHRAVNDASSGTGAAAASSSALSFTFIWGSMMSVILLFFLMSCIQQFAQFYQTMKDAAESDRLRSLLPTNVRNATISPMRSSELIFGAKKSPNPAIIMRTPNNEIPNAARVFANVIRSKHAPKYDIVHISTTYDPVAQEGGSSSSSSSSSSGSRPTLPSPSPMKS